jgi:hypothetical protein
MTGVMGISAGKDKINYGKEMVPNGSLSGENPELSE